MQLRTLIFLLFFLLMLNTTAHAQVGNKPEADTVVNSRIREKVIGFFQKQHMKFRDELKGLNQQYIVYAKFNYEDNGSVSTFAKIEEDSLLPKQIANYINFLIYSAGNVWRKDVLGYEGLEKGDEFGFKFILTPQNMPDSLSFIGKHVFEHYRTPDDKELSVQPQNSIEKQWAYLAGRSLQYSWLAMGLGNRYQVISLKY